MLKEIKEFNDKKDLMEMVKSDDNTVVFFKKQFNPDTGVEKKMETVTTFSDEELQERINETQADLDVLEAFKVTINKK